MASIARPGVGQYLAALDEAGHRILALTADLDPATRVPTCPDWDVVGLVEHLGRVWHAHGTHLPRGVVDPPTGARPEPPSDPAAVHAWSADGLAALLDVLRATPPQAPAWNFLGAPHTAGFWHRRMAHEVLMHRRDAELAAGQRPTAYGPLATDGIDEVLRSFLPALGPVEQVRGVVGLSAGDARWVLDVGPGGRSVLDGPPTALDASVSAAADELVCGVWGRTPLAELDATGSPALLEAVVLRR